MYLEKLAHAKNRVIKGDLDALLVVIYYTVVFRVDETPSHNFFHRNCLEEAYTYPIGKISSKSDIE